jgi:DMSO/TMAO reductase YedYZ molybdopterin-dependent catalytic subunit
MNRRKWIAAAAGASGVAVAARLASRYGLIPPDHGGIWGIGETLTYGAQRVLTSRHSFAREFDRSQISKIAPENGRPPQNDIFRRLLANRFADWRLTVDGLVARPSSFSLVDLKSFPPSSDITMQACEEGWSFIAESTGVPLSYVLNLAGVSPQAKFVVYESIDSEWWDSVDIREAWHPQTLLAYGMNGEDLPTGHGAPLRLRVPRQLGYKSVKHLSRITVVDDIKKVRTGRGSGSPDAGYSWYAGI